MSTCDSTLLRPLWRVAYDLVGQQPALGLRLRRALRLLDTTTFQQTADTIIFADGAIVRLPNCTCSALACQRRPLCDHECAAFLIRRATDDVAALSTLSARERSVLAQRSADSSGKQRTLADIGQELGISRERVRQIEVKARRKLEA